MKGKTLLCLALLLAAAMALAVEVNTKHITYGSLIFKGVLKNPQ